MKRRKWLLRRPRNVSGQAIGRPTSYQEHTSLTHGIVAEPAMLGCNRNGVQGLHATDSVERL
jgi:hypothetical protein